MRRMPSLAALLSLALLLASPAWSAPRGAATSPRPLTAAARYGGATEALALRPPYAYVGVGSGLDVVSLADPGRPAVVASLPLEQRPIDIAVAGGYAYVVTRPVSAAGDYAQRLWVLSLADPAAPALQAMVALPSWSFTVRLAVAEGRLYLTGNGVQVYSLAQPARPALLGSFGQSSNPYSLAVRGTTAYVGAGDGLHIFDAADPARAIEVGSFLPGAAAGIADIAVAGDIVATLSPQYDGGSSSSVVRILYVGVPAEPLRLSSLTLPGFARRIALDGQRLYLLSGRPYPESGSELRLIDISDPSEPRAHAALPLDEETTAAPGGLALGRGFAVATARWGLGIIALDAGGDPSGVAQHVTSSYQSVVDVAGPRLLLGGDPGQIVTLGDLLRGWGGLRLGGLGPPTYPARRGRLLGERLLVAEGEAGLGIYRVAPTGAVSETARLDTAGELRDVRAAGDRAYALDTAEGLISVDISRPDAPARLGAAPLNGEFSLYTELVVEGDRAFVSSLCDRRDIMSPVARVELFSLGGPAPQRAGGVATTCLPPTSIAVRGDLLFLLEPTGCIVQGCASIMLRAFDISDAAAPQSRGSISLGPGGFNVGLAAADGHVVALIGYSDRFVNEPGGRVQVVAFSPDGAALSVVEEALVPGTPGSLAVAGPWIIVGAGPAGVISYSSGALFRPTSALYLPAVAR